MQILSHLQKLCIINNVLVEKRNVYIIVYMIIVIIFSF
jgi:hypothetical protein